MDEPEFSLGIEEIIKQSGDSFAKYVGSKPQASLALNVLGYGLITKLGLDISPMVGVLMGVCFAKSTHTEYSLDKLTEKTSQKIASSDDRRVCRQNAIGNVFASQFCTMNCAAIATLGLLSQSYSFMIGAAGVGFVAYSRYIARSASDRFLQS